MKWLGGIGIGLFVANIYHNQDTEEFIVVYSTDGKKLGPDTTSYESDFESARGTAIEELKFMNKKYQENKHSTGYNNTKRNPII